MKADWQAFGAPDTCKKAGLVPKEFIPTPWQLWPAEYGKAYSFSSNSGNWTVAKGGSKVWIQMISENLFSCDFTLI